MATNTPSKVRLFRKIDGSTGPASLSAEVSFAASLPGMSKYSLTKDASRLAFLLATLFLLTHCRCGGTEPKESATPKTPAIQLGEPKASWIVLENIQDSPKMIGYLPIDASNPIALVVKDEIKRPGFERPKQFQQFAAVQGARFAATSPAGKKTS